MTHVIVVVSALLAVSPADVPGSGDGAPAASSDVRASAGELAASSDVRVSGDGAPAGASDASASAGGPARSRDVRVSGDGALAGSSDASASAGEPATSRDVPVSGDAELAKSGGPSVIPASAASGVAPASLAPSTEPAPPVDHARVRRFVGAFLGGVVGFAVPLALAPVFSCPTGFGSCLGPGHLALAFTSPLLGLTGSVAGYVAAGGQASAAGLGALFPATLTSLGVMAAMSQMDPALLTSWLPGVIAGGAVLSLTSALLLTWREDATDGLEDGAGTGRSTRVRVAATIAASTAMALAGSVAVLGAVLACRFNCSSTVAVGLSVALLAGHAYAAWGVHRTLGGRAPAWSPLLLMALDGALFGLVMLAAWLPGSTPGAFGEAARNGLSELAAGVAVVAGLTVAPMLVFEALHTRALQTSKAGGLRVGVAPAPGGGLVTAGLAW